MKYVALNCEDLKDMSRNTRMMCVSRSSSTRTCVYNVPGSVVRVLEQFTDYLFHLKHAAALGGQRGKPRHRKTCSVDVRRGSLAQSLCSSPLHCVTLTPRSWGIPFSFFTFTTWFLNYVRLIRKDVNKT